MFRNALSHLLTSDNKHSTVRHLALIQVHLRETEVSTINLKQFSEIKNLKNFTFHFQSIQFANCSQT